MAKTVAAFYELPPWVEKMNQLQRQMDSLTRPLGEFQTDYAGIDKNSCRRVRFACNPRP